MKPINLLLFSLMFSATAHAAQDLKILSANTKNLEVNEKDCIHASKHNMFLVTPIKVGDTKKYNVTELHGRYEYIGGLPLKDQVAKRQFLGRKLCNGIVSYSDMDLPFVKSVRMKINDANDGILLIEFAKTALVDIRKVYEVMLDIANTVSPELNNQFPDNVRSKFNNYKNEARRLGATRTFAGENIAYGLQVSVPVNNKRDHIEIESQELNLNLLSRLELDSVDAGPYVATQLNEMITVVDKNIKRLDVTLDQLKKTAKKDAVITSVDLREDIFVVRKEKSKA